MCEVDPPQGRARTAGAQPAPNARVELTSAIHDYIELWHNTRRRHSALGMLTPTEYETIHTNHDKAA